MNSREIEKALLDLKSSSKTSMFMVVLGAIFLLGSVYYSATRLTPLEDRLEELTNKVRYLNALVNEKQSKLDLLENTLDSTRRELSNTNSALDMLQEGIRDILTAQYSDAINIFKEYIKLFPKSAEAMNFLGYSELRYAQYWRDKSIKAGIAKEEKNEYFDNIDIYAKSAERHLKMALSLSPGYSWPQYNLAILYFQSGKKDLALSAITEMLEINPGMIKWLCDDGQFRKMKTDNEISDQFTDIVNEVVRIQGKDSCWVTKPVIIKR